MKRKEFTNEMLNTEEGIKQFVKHVVSMGAWDKFGSIFYVIIRKLENDEKIIPNDIKELFTMIYTDSYVTAKNIGFKHTLPRMYVENGIVTYNNKENINCDEFIEKTKDIPIGIKIVKK